MIKKVTSVFNARILIVDDYVDNQELLKSILEKMECEVDVAEDGQEALQMFLESEYDAIFMDIQMPVMDGFETTRKIREAEKGGSHVPIIALTANALEGDKEKCLEAGMDDYLAKPFRGVDIETALSKYLEPMS